MPYYNPLYLHEAAEGQAQAIVTDIKKYITDPRSTFVRMVILETISDPDIITDEKIDYWATVLGVTNIRFAKVLPRNTVIAQNMLTGVTQITPPMFLLPFFPSHLSLPCKPGEMVWVMFENPDSKIKEMGYWFCRISEPHFADDVNHTHHARQLDHSFKSTLRKRAAGEDDPVYELRNGKVNKSKDGTRFVVSNSEIISAENADVFEKLVSETDAAKMIQYESIPRFKKRPGDISLEGSNNTLIVLGTDRSGPVSDYEYKNDESENPLPVQLDNDLVGNAGSIDIVAGRGSTTTTGGKEVITKRMLDGQELKKELEKTIKEYNGLTDISQEGNPDMTEDRSRILLSQRTMTDTNFSLNDYMTNNFYDIKDDDKGDASVVIKSDKIRIIARSDISLIVTGFLTLPSPTELSSKGDYKSQINNSDFWASITIRQNGDIIFTPSVNGVIKLGGEGADKAILCTSMSAINDRGSVSAKPIATTGGGFVGTSGGNIDKEAVGLSRAPDLGTFSKKVLIS